MVALYKWVFCVWLLWQGIKVLSYAEYLAQNERNTGGAIALKAVVLLSSVAVYFS